MTSVPPKERETIEAAGRRWVVRHVERTHYVILDATYRVVAVIDRAPGTSATFAYALTDGIVPADVDDFVGRFKSRVRCIEAMAEAIVGSVAA